MFIEPQLTCLGHKVSKEGIKSLEDKVDVISNAPAPKNVSELKWYLGMIKNNQKILSNLSSVLAPLNELPRKGTRWYWGEEQKEEFQKSKEFLKSSRLLVHYDSQELTLACDASQHCLGAVLSRRMDDGSEHEIAYAARTLSNAKSMFNLEREAFALTFSVKKYIYGRHFNLLTDYKPSESLFNENMATPTMAAAGIQRWTLTLAAYRYSIEYKPGLEHANAHALSRRKCRLVVRILRCLQKLCCNGTSQFDATERDWDKNRN